MDELFKKLDEIMTSDLVRKIGGLICLITIVIVAAAFLVGAGSVLKTMKGQKEVAETPAEEEAMEESAEEEEETDEAAEEEAEH